MTQTELIKKISKEIKQPGCNKKDLNEFAEQFIKETDIVDVIPDKRKGVLAYVDSSGKTTVARVIIS